MDMLEYLAHCDTETFRLLLPIYCRPMREIAEERLAAKRALDRLMYDHTILPSGLVDQFGRSLDGA